LASATGLGCGAVKPVREANGKPLPGNLWSLQTAKAGLPESTPQDPNEDAKEQFFKPISASALPARHWRNRYAILLEIKNAREGQNQRLHLGRSGLAEALGEARLVHSENLGGVGPGIPG